MSHSNPFFKKLVGAIALAVALVLGQVAAAGVASARDGHDGHSRHRAETTTDLKVYSHSACAFVSSDHGTPTGTVTFKLTNHKTQTATVTLKRGKACVGLRLKPGKYELTATYNGSRHFKPSSDSADRGIHLTGVA